MKVEVDVLGSPSLIMRTVSVDVTLKKNMDVKNGRVFALKYLSALLQVYTPSCTLRSSSGTILFKVTWYN